MGIAALLLPVAALAHRVDEYLEATLLSIDSGHVEGSMRLVPGVAVSSAVIARIDSNSDGIVSESEQRAYAQNVLRDLSVKADGRLLAVHLAGASFPSIEAMKQGVGGIELSFTADLPRGGGTRTLIFENHHESNIAVYLVNCLVPLDKDIHITGQRRNENQSFYQLDFTQDGAVVKHTAVPRLAHYGPWIAVGLLMFGLATGIRYTNN